MYKLLEKHNFTIPNGLSVKKYSNKLYNIVDNINIVHNVEEIPNNVYEQVMSVLYNDNINAQSISKKSKPIIKQKFTKKGKIKTNKNKTRKFSGKK